MMKKILGICAVIACCAELSAMKVKVVNKAGDRIGDTVAVLSEKQEPILFAVTNNSAKKTRITVKILRKNNGRYLSDSDDFNIMGNDIYINPHDTEKIKLSSYIETPETQEFVAVFRNSGGNEVRIPLVYSPSPKSEIKLERIKTDRDGFLKAIIDRRSKSAER
ncbi:MAG: hypothetical protein LBO73_03085 [Holosporaceae bacterium]|nr:hypothetical protein [Holosporaceae bacterium]